MHRVYNKILILFLAISLIIIALAHSITISAHDVQKKSCKSCHKKIFEKQYSYPHEPFLNEQCNECHLNESDKSSETENPELSYINLSSLDINHQINLTNLSPDTDYSFRLKAKDTYGKIIYSDIYSFNTKKIHPDSISPLRNSSDNLPPKISNIQLHKIIKGVLNQVTISWKTDEPSNSQIIHGLDTRYEDITPLDTRFLTEHEITLNNISFEKDIHFQVKSEDINGNLATSDDQIFNVQKLSSINQSPVIKNLKIKHLSSKIVKITFQTNNYASTDIALGKDTSYNLFNFSDSVYTKNHEVDISPLSPETHYLLKISSMDVIGNNTTVEKDFITIADKDGPIIREVGIQYLTPWNSDIEWLTDEDSDSQIYYSTDLSYNLNSKLDPVMKNLHKITLSGLTPASIYHFQVRSKDKYGNLSLLSNNILITPSSEKEDYPFDIKRIQIKSVNNNSASIKCQTSQMSRLTCEYEVNEKFKEIISKDQVKSKHGTYGLKNLRQAGMDTCSKCHTPNDLGLSHPVGIYAKGKKTEIPKELPTGEDGIILCITCHNPHGSNKKYLARLVLSKDLCIACHKDFKF